MNSIETITETQAIFHLCYSLKWSHEHAIQIKNNETKVENQIADVKSKGIFYHKLKYCFENCQMNCIINTPQTSVRSRPILDFYVIHLCRCRCRCCCPYNISTSLVMTDRRWNNNRFMLHFLFFVHLNSSHSHCTLTKSFLFCSNQNRK